MTEEQLKFFRRGKRSCLEFLADSAEQIARSINMIGLRTEIDQAFAAAIAEAGGHPQSSFGPAINGTREADAGDDASVKQSQHQNS